MKPYESTIGNMTVRAIRYTGERDNQVEIERELQPIYQGKYEVPWIDVGFVRFVATDTELDVNSEHVQLSVYLPDFDNLTEHKLIARTMAHYGDYIVLYPDLTLGAMDPEAFFAHYTLAKDPFSRFLYHRHSIKKVCYAAFYDGTPAARDLVEDLVDTLNCQRMVNVLGKAHILCPGENPNRATFISVQWTTTAGKDTDVNTAEVFPRDYLCAIQGETGYYELISIPKTIFEYLYKQGDDENS